MRVFFIAQNPIKQRGNVHQHFVACSENKKRLVANINYIELIKINCNF